MPLASTRAAGARQEAPPRRSRYLRMPVVAFRAGEPLDGTRLPLRVERREWRTLAALLAVLFGFLVFVNGMVALEDRFWPTVDGEPWGRFLGATRVLAAVLLVGAVWAWMRVDELHLDRERVRILRRGPIGTDLREAPLSSYRGVRVTTRFVEDSEAMGGTTFWQVELVHDDPGLTVALFSASRREPSSAAPRTPGGAPMNWMDWTDESRRLAGEWSRDLGVPLLSS